MKGMSVSCKTKKLLFLLVLVFAWILFAFSTDGPDYSIYQNWYRTTEISGLITRFEVGFSLLMLICTSLGLSFQEFMMIISAIGLILIASSLTKYCKYPMIAFFLYLLYPFVFDIVQIRNFISFAIVFYGLRYLTFFTPKNAVKFGVCCILASLMHISSVFYFSFFIAYLRKYRHIVVIIFILTIVILIVSIVFPEWFYRFMHTFGSDVYLNAGSTLGKVIGYGAFAVMATLLEFISCFGKEARFPVTDSFTRSFCRLIPVMILCCAAIAVTSQAYRFFRNMSLIVYIVFLNDGVSFKNSRCFIGRSWNYCNSAFAVLFSVFFHIRQISHFAPLYDEMTKRVIGSNSFLFKW